MKQSRISQRAVTVQTREDGSRAITGYGAVFYNANDPGTQFELWPGCFERIDPRAFDSALQSKADVRACFNHDANQILGRTSAGTMRLSVDFTGLRYEVDVPDTQLGRDLVTSIERGDVTGSSFMFSIRSVERVVGKDGNPDLRIIKDLELYETGPVTFPAYESATAGVRDESGIAETRAEHEAWKRQRDRDLLQIED